MIDDKKREEFLAKNSLDGGFFQSNFWANFQIQKKQNFHWVESGENKSLVIENELPIVGKYFYIPRGPIFGSDNKDNEILLKKIKEQALKKGVGWIRFEPQSQKDLNRIGGNLKKAHKNHQPAETIMIDLNKKTEDILSEMKQKTRYNIRLSSKKGVQVKTLSRKQGLEIFWKLVQETAKRDGVSFHQRDYYQQMLEAIPEKNLKILVAFKDDLPISVILVSFFGKVAIYLHGASSDENRELMASYLLQWESIQLARQEGMEKYDFFGIAVELNKDKWGGITRFKIGFKKNFKPVIFPGCYDLVLSPGRYHLYRLLQLIKG